MIQTKKLIINKNNNVLVLHLMSSSKCIDSVNKQITIVKKDVVGNVIDPHEFLYLVRSSINEIIVKNPKIKIHEIEIVGDMNSLLLCDKISSTALTPAFILSDDRALKITNSLKKTSFSKMYFDITQQEISSYSWFSFLKWFKTYGINHYSINLKNCYCMTLENYLLINLTNKKENTIDLTTASSSGIFDFFNKEISKTIVKDLDFPMATLPKINHSPSINDKTNGFVPLNDNILISKMKNQDFFRWEIMPKKSFGSLNIHFSEESISLNIYLGEEESIVKKGCQKIIFSNEKTNSIGIKEVIKISNIQSGLIKKKFKDIVCENRLFISENIWMVINALSENTKNQFAIINLNQSDNENNILDAYLEGVFHLIKMKLNQVQDFYDISNLDIFCTTSLDINNNVWNLLCNSVQSSIILLNLNQLLQMPDIYFENLSNSSSPQGTKVSKKKNPITFLIPTLDPISSYARFQTWMSYYKKIFEN